jgi:hypothetical protein
MTKVLSSSCCLGFLAAAPDKNQSINRFVVSLWLDVLLDDPLISKSQTIGAPFFRVLLFYIWANNSNICRGETYVIEMLDTQQQQPSLKKETSDES